jgi:hypothetical protein
MKSITLSISALLLSSAIAMPVMPHLPGTNHERPPSLINGHGDEPVSHDAQGYENLSPEEAAAYAEYLAGHDGTSPAMMPTTDEHNGSGPEDMSHVTAHESPEASHKAILPSGRIAMIPTSDEHIGAGPEDMSHSTAHESPDGNERRNLFSRRKQLRTQIQEINQALEKSNGNGRGRRNVRRGNGNRVVMKGRGNRVMGGSGNRGKLASGR